MYIEKHQSEVEGAIIDDIAKKIPGGIKNFFADLLKSNREIHTTNSSKGADGSLRYNVDMVLLDDDGSAKAAIPAKIIVAPVELGNNEKINFFMQLPDASYATTRKFNDVDTTDFRNMDNSKKAVEKACWTCFDNNIDSNDEEFLNQFVIDEDRFEFSKPSTQTFSCMYEVEGEDVEVEFQVQIDPTDDSKRAVNLSFRYPDPSNLDAKLTAKDKFKNVTNNRDVIIKKVQDFTKEVYGVDSLEQIPDNLTASASINTTKSIKCTMQKVKAGTGFHVQMTNIFANYDPSTVLLDLQTVAEDSSFIDGLDYDIPTSCDLTVNDDDISIDIVSEAANITDCRICAYDTILNCAYRLYFDLKYSNYTAVGADMGSIINLSENYIWRISEMIDTVNKMVLEDNLILMHPIDRIHQITINCQSQDTNWSWFIQMIRNDVEMLISALTLYCDNMTEDKQEQINTWIRSWAYEKAYTLAQATK